MKTKGWVILGIVSGTLGSFYEFTPRNTIKSFAEFLIFDVKVLGYRIRHNDIILFATVMLIISLVSLYKVYKLMRNKNSV